MIAFLWWRVLAFFLARYELIQVEGADYLSRWHFPAWLARWNRCTYLFLHHFHTSDPDREWHCHPWSWCESRLLLGEYVQEIPRWTERGTCVTSRARFWAGGRVNMLTTEYHRVYLRSRRVWTLFRAGPKHGRSWGFKDYAGHFTPANDEKETERSC